MMKWRLHNKSNCTVEDREKGLFANSYILATWFFQIYANYRQVSIVMNVRACPILIHCTRSRNTRFYCTRKYLFSDGRNLKSALILINDTVLRNSNNARGLQWKSTRVYGFLPCSIVTDITLSISPLARIYIYVINKWFMFIQFRSASCKLRRVLLTTK